MLWTWDSLYLMLPFILSAWIKTVNHWFMHNVQMRALEGIPGYENDATLKDVNKREIIIGHIEHGEEKTFSIHTFTASLIAAILVGVGSGHIGPAIVGAAILAATLVFVPSWLNNIPAGGLSLPIRGGAQSKWVRGSTLLYLFNVSADLIVIALIAMDRYQTVAPAIN
jgi:hypothetical protein